MNAYPIYFSTLQAGALVVFHDSTRILEAREKDAISLPAQNNIKYVPWGESNDAPLQIIDIIKKNPAAMRALEMKLDVAYGGGVKVGKMVEGTFAPFTPEELEAGELADVKLFLHDNDLDDFYSELFSDLLWFYWGAVEFILSLDLPEKRRINRITTLEATFSRWAITEDIIGITHHAYAADWKQIDEKNTTITPALSARNPKQDLLRRIGREEYFVGKKLIKKDEKQFKYVLPIQVATPSKLYYPSPYWQSIITSGWADYMNLIPVFKTAIMKNSATFRYVIEIDDNYFPTLFAKEMISDPEKQKERQQSEFQNIEKYLTGVEAAGKMFITYTSMGGDGSLHAQISIKVLENKIGGELIDDTHEAVAMTLLAMGIHPSLIGVIPGKTTSNLSGSDKRELLRIAQSLQKRLRDKALKPLEIVKAVNNWPPYVTFAFSDIILTTLDSGRETTEYYTS